MIDYEITVNVLNLTHEEKKRVQDAFFKLGIIWRSGTDYACLNRGCYTNKFKGGKVTQDLMWAEVSTKPTHTVDELLELAGMKTKADLKPFDIEKALAGEPVVLRDGAKAYIRHYETEFETNYPLIGYRVNGTEGIEVSWTVEGNALASREETVRDIVGMWVEPLVFEHWDLLLEDIKYLAKDGDGYWYGYDGKPNLRLNNWFASEDYWEIPLKPSLFPDCGWENSLIERPEND